MSRCPLVSRVSVVSSVSTALANIEMRPLISAPSSLPPTAAIPGHHCFSGASAGLFPPLLPLFLFSPLISGARCCFLWVLSLICWLPDLILGVFSRCLVFPFAFCVAGFCGPWRADCDAFCDLQICIILSQTPWIFHIFRARVLAILSCACSPFACRVMFHLSFLLAHNFSRPLSS